MRKILNLLPLLILFVAGTIDAGVAQSSNTADESISEQLDTAKELHMSGEEQQSLVIYKNVLKEDADNIEALWNASILHAKIGRRQESENDMRDHYEKARELAERAVENHPDNGHAYYARAVAIGRMTMLMKRRDKIDASRKVKESIEKASELIPDFAPVWHMYGVWHSDVANMSGIAKFTAGLFSGGIPDASNEKAEEYLEKAISMDKDNILFHIDLAKHYLEVDSESQARPLLEEIVNMEPQMKDDPRYIEEAEQLLNKIIG